MRVSIFEAKRCTEDASTWLQSSPGVLTLRYPRRESVALFAKLGRSNGIQRCAIFVYFCWFRASAALCRLFARGEQPFGLRRPRPTLSSLITPEYVALCAGPHPLCTMGQRCVARREWQRRGHDWPVNLVCDEKSSIMT